MKACLNRKGNHILKDEANSKIEVYGTSLHGIDMPLIHRLCIERTSRMPGGSHQMFAIKLQSNE